MIWLAAWGAASVIFVFGAAWGKIMTEREMADYLEIRYQDGWDDGFECGQMDARLQD